ncbi:MAG: hypothetical protein WA160_08635 [Pseudobdellovibrio sp.]
MNEENDNSEALVKSRRDNVALHEQSVQKINAWIEQVKTKKKGVKISKKDFINWLIEKTPDALSNADMNAVIDKFYDEEIFLRQLLREVKKARLDGYSEPSLEFVVKTKKVDQRKEELPVLVDSNKADE